MPADPTPITEIARRFTLADPDLADDPYPVYERLRRECPVARSDVHGGFWVLTRYADVHYACQHPEIFSSNPVHIPANMGQDRPLIPLEIDPPEHAKYRQILAPLFAPHRVEPLEKEIRSAVNELIDAFIDTGECEFVSQLAAPLPTRIFLHLMGWPEKDAPQFHEWKDAIIHGVPGDEEASNRVREEAGLALYTYFAEILDQRTDNPQDDIVSALLGASYGGERPLTQFEVLDIIFLLLIAGLDTTTVALANAFSFLAESPDHRRQLAEDPGVTPAAIEELLRWESPIGPGRTVTHDVDFGGFSFKKGDRVLLVMGATGRDDEGFPNAQQVDFGRTVNRHLAFGAGPHRCLGAYLARLEMRVAFEEFHRRIPDYTVAPGKAVKRQLTSVKGVTELPLVFPVASQGK